MSRREQPSAKLLPGAVVSGKYKVVERLGGGGMGDVYRAEHQLAGRIVALKLLRSDFAEDPDLVRRFFQEAQAVNRIRHPNIVDVLDAGVSEQGPYVVMECLEGVNASDALARFRRFDLPTALSVMMPVLDALEAAHRVGIVHRDLKPENVFIAKSGIAKAADDDVRVKILDFGIAKVTDAPEGAARPQTHTGIIFGTPDYLSPEQASGEGVVDGRSDIFAAGIVLFELLTGRRPFEAKSAVATAYKIVHEPAPRLGSLGVHVDPRVEEALDIALAKSQADRFATAGTFADMLAPLVPEGIVRRESLRALVRRGNTVPPTQPAPELAEKPGDRAAELPPDPAPPPAATSTPPPPTSLGPAQSPTLISGVGYPKRESGGPPVLHTPRASSFPPRTSPVPSTPRTTSSIRAILGRPTIPTPGTPHPHQGSWTPRPLPVHAKEHCHVRGSFARAVSRWIERAYGKDAREQVFQMLAPDDADAFRSDSLNALVWYELESTDMFVEASTAVLMDNQPGAWRTLARENFDKDLGPILRTTTRLVDVPTLLTRAIAGWGRLFDFGHQRVVGAVSTRAIVKVESFEAASLALRYVVLGSMDGLLENAGVLEPQIRVIAGESSFARDFEYEVSWRP